jgi:hypothetical protein
MRTASSRDSAPTRAHIAAREMFDGQQRRVISGCAMLGAMSASRLTLVVVGITVLILLVASQAGYLPRTVGVIGAVVAIGVFRVLSFRGNRRP